MNLDVALLGALLVPVMFVAGALCASRTRPFAVAKVVAATAATCAAIAAAVRVLVSASADPSSILQRLVVLDVPTCSMLLLVCGLALVIVRYSARYLEGEPNVRRYERALLSTLASVTTLLTSNHLLVVALAWVATSLSLHQLLVFYADRRQALVAAHKKFLLSRLADVCVIAALALVGNIVGSLRIDAVNAFAAARAELPAPLHAATCLLALAVILKSAQLPFHGWMTQVMEAPTPVSALLHAGVVNIGGFVMIRLAVLVGHAPVAQALLLAFGLVTSSVASLVMMTRVSVKVSLAWSTIAQMGFMLVQCGLGAWHVALLHLVAHSAYKAHAFLTAGSVVRDWQAQALVRRPQVTFRRMAAATALATAIVGVLVTTITLAQGYMALVEVGPLAFIMAVSLAPVLERALGAGRRVTMRCVLAVSLATAACFAWHTLFAALVPSSRASSVPVAGWWVVVAAFTAIFVVQSTLRARPGGRLAVWLTPRLFAGFNLDEWFTRMTFRVWPPTLARPAARPTVPSWSSTREVQL